MPAGPKLRAPRLERPFHVALVEPEIPPNTGAVARTCAATGSPLHLIGELGFRIDEQSVRRAGLDYWHLVDLRRHDDWEAFLDAEPSRALHLFTANASRSYLDAALTPGDVLVFGRESVGLPNELVERYADRAVAIPTLGEVRSLNLSNAVAIALYEGLRRSGALDSSSLSMA
jgi:tRNA (cytidine/uridine-2'-O-)-methyltransferase